MIVAPVWVGISLGVGRDSVWGQQAKQWRAVIMGHTGRGNFGHRLDVLFRDREEIGVAGVYDGDKAGLEKAMEKSGAETGYDDYEAMLKAEKPDLAVVAPRHVDQHHAMGMAALRAGAHVYMEKPFTESLGEADELLAEAERQGLRIAVAHQMRAAPGILLLKQAVEQENLIGELLEVRLFGKQDERAGGEDMMVLGTHLFDLSRFFAGDPEWCTARVLNEGGEDITKADARSGKNDVLGPVAGREIEAQFAFPNGVNGRFVSRRRHRNWPGSWGMMLVGTKGAVFVRAGHPARIYVLEGREGRPQDEPMWEGTWKRWAKDPAMEEEKKILENAARMDIANERVVDDWLAAIVEEREPMCSGRDAMLALEMIHAVYAAALRGERVTFPLEERGHPLE